ncbi:MAG: DUF4856 domain-containing protein, partial [Gramella sp.]|nr:DUF4856 domain-containing protein [Christiangramia sp.]
MRKLLFSAILGGLSLVSCTSDDTPAPGGTQIETPVNYTFQRDNISTVNYSGQTARLQMTDELLSNFNDFDSATEELLSNMFANENAPFEDASLNESSKSVKSKIAASNLYFSTNNVESSKIKADFENWISVQMNEVATNRNQIAQPGVAGQIADGDAVRYVDSKGVEVDQAFGKSLIGALVVDQMLNNYLASAVLDEGDNRANNDAGITEEGKVYTTMEHKWDEAYGYL